MLSLVPSLSADTSLTLYNDDFGVVRETVPLDLTKGISKASFSGVTTKLEPESVILRDPAGEVAFQVVEQSYRGDPVDLNRLLEFFEGETIDFLQRLDDEEVIVQGRIVRAPSTIMSVDRFGNERQMNLEPIFEVKGQLRFSPPGIPLFPTLGDDSILRPTLSWQVFSESDATLDAQLSYLTRGMSWKADYNVVLPEKGDNVSLTGWVSLTNETGTNFTDAAIKLIAGDVNKVEDAQPARLRDMYALEMARAAPPEVETRKFDEFHLYQLPQRTTLRDQETKQVEFVRADGVPTAKLYVYDGLSQSWNRNRGLNQNENFGTNSNSDVAIYREFENREENGLGMALPAGRLRFYRLDQDGQLEFTGENEIDHTPKNETIRVYLGNAFDLVGERTRTDFFRHRTNDLMRESFEIELRNRSEEPATIRVVEHLYRWVNWELTTHSHDFTKTDAQTIVFDIDLAPDEVKQVTYTVEYTW